MARYLRDDPCIYQVADLRIDVGRRSLTRAGVDIQLPKLSFDLLLALVEAAPNVVTTEAFMELVWPGLVVGSETVVQRVKLLRDALGDDPRNPTYVAGVRGLGYRLIPTVSKVTAEPPSAPQLIELGSVKPQAPKPQRRFMIAATAAIVLVGLSLSSWIYLTSSRPSGNKLETEVAVTGATIRTVAVMPFEDLSIAHDNGQLASALPEMVLQRLGMVNDLIVIARSSSFAFIGKNLDAREIGARLDARYLVEGALQRDGDRLRVTAQLVDAESGRQLKSFEFDRSISDVFALQDEIAGQLATALQVHLLSVDMKRVDRSRNTSLDAYLSYLNSQVLMNRWIVKDVEKAAAELQRAIDLDPNFALAYAELARAKQISFFLRRGYHKNDKLPELLGLVNKALQLDPQLGEAYAIRASLEFGVDPAAGDADFRKGILLAPNYGPGYEMYAEELGDIDRGEEGMAMLERAILIDPVAPRNIYYKGVYLQNRDKEAAEKAFKRALELGPEFPPSFARLAIARWQEGKVAEAIKLIERALRVETQSTWINAHAVAMYLEIGDRRAAAEIAQNAPEDFDPSTMVKAYDGLFDQVPRNDIDYEFGLNAANYAYWISMEHRSPNEPAVAAIFEDARRILQFSGDGKDYSLPKNADWGVAIALAWHLKARGEQIASANLTDATLKAVVGVGNVPGHFLAVFDMLRDQPQAALEKLSKEIRQTHWSMFWICQRDPLFDPIKSQPAYAELVDLENSRMAEQRKILEQMRAMGDVPRR